MNAVLQLAEMVGASWLLWRLSRWCYRPRPPRDARDVDRWPVEKTEPACRVVGPSGLRSGR